MEEFSRAAQLYTRVNSVMAARFTHGNHGDAIDSNTSAKGTEDMEVRLLFTPCILNLSRIKYG